MSRFREFRLQARDNCWPFAVWTLVLFELAVGGTLRGVILTTSLAAAILLTVWFRRRNERDRRKGLSGWTIIATVGALLIWNGIDQIVETSHHRGQGWVDYEWEELVEESTYKRHNYVMGGVGIALGAFALYLIRFVWRADSVDPKHGQRKDDRASN